MEIGDVVAHLEPLGIQVHTAARNFLAGFGDLRLVHEPSAEIRGRLVTGFTDTEDARHITEHERPFRSYATKVPTGRSACGYRARNRNGHA